MANKEPSARQQFVFIVIILAVLVALIYGLSFELPDDSRKLSYMLVWIVVLGGTFYFVEKIVRSFFRK